MVSEQRAETTRSHVGHLPWLVERAVVEADLRLDEIDAIAVSAGPGSFTGLRIGVSFAKGLAFSGAIPMVGVSTLEAHARCVDSALVPWVCVANDARKGEVYAALFEVRGSEVVRISPDAAWRPEDLLRTLPADTIIVGDAGAILSRYLPTGRRGPRLEVVAPSGGIVAVLGAEAVAAGRASEVGTFEPTYVRAPDATLPARPLR